LKLIRCYLEAGMMSEGIVSTRTEGTLSAPPPNCCESDDAKVACRGPTEAPAFLRRKSAQGKAQFRDGRDENKPV